uniref:MARVEL domain-containing protein n=1 Tax=Syphacia muris TaxID=451379 RepID=A0A0N5AHH7_9BILA
MDRYRPEPKCFFGLCHILISCKWIATLDLVMSIAVSAVLLELSLDNCFWIPPALCILAVVFMIILYIYGLFKENDNCFIVAGRQYCFNHRLDALFAFALFYNNLSKSH